MEVKKDFKTLVKEYCKDRQNPSPGQELIYLGEVQDKCPKCGKPLLHQGTKKVNKNFEIAHIFPCNPTPNDMAVLDGVELYGDDSESSDNKIALCRDCHKDYDNNKTREKYDYYLGLKKRLKTAYLIQESVSKFEIESELKEVISRLNVFTSEDVPDTYLDYDAKMITEKIDAKENFALINSIQSDVRTYFVFIRNQIKYYCNLSNSDIESVAIHFKGAFLKCKQNKMNVEDTFAAMMNWVKSKSGCSDSIAHILVSYFVQNCEIYEKLPE